MRSRSILALIAMVAAGVATNQASLVLGAQTPRPTFEVASVRPWVPGSEVKGGANSLEANGQFDRSRTTVEDLIRFAFDLRPYQVVGGPEWIRRTNFAVHARGDKNASVPQLRPMVQALLEDRFKLKAHSEKREMRTYVLTLARPDRRFGAGLKPVTDGKCQNVVSPANRPQGSIGASGCGPLSGLTTLLSGALASPVVDKTGLEGMYVYAFYHSREGLAIPARSVDASLPPPPPDTGNAPSLMTALREQLGLRLDAARDEVPVLVVDSVQQPTGN